MKPFLPTLAAGSLLLAPLAQAQSDAPIRASMTVRTNTRTGEQTRSSLVSNPEAGTTEETITDMQGKLLSKVTYLMDEKNQPIGSMTYNAKGAMLYKTAFKRDALNRVDEESISDSAGQLLRRRVYTYGNGSEVLNIMEYDGSGNLVSDGRTRKTMRAQPAQPASTHTAPSTPVVRKGRR